MVEINDRRIIYARDSKTHQFTHPEYAVPFQEVADLFSGTNKVIQEAYRYSVRSGRFLPVTDRETLGRITSRIEKEEAQANIELMLNFGRDLELFWRGEEDDPN